MTDEGTSINEASQLYLEEISKKIESGDDIRVSDIVILSDTLQLAERNDEDVVERIQVYEAISKAITNKDDMSMEETA